MRLVFVDNLLFEDAENVRRYVLQPHLGLISLIAVLEAAGHEGILFDPKIEVSRGNLQFDDRLYRRIARQVLDFQPDIVGFTSLGCNFICTAKTAAYLRSSKADVPILLGGPHATVLDREILESFPQFDIICRNEAECTILPLLAAIPDLAFDEVSGISYRDRGVVRQNPGEPLITDLDTLPMPAYHKYPINELGLKSLRVDAGRGCPFQCTFCSTASFFGRKYRLKSSNRLVNELDQLHATYGVSDFALTHDLFTVNRHKVREFCNAVSDRGYTWKCSARMDCVDPELLERMAAAGCKSIYYGIEAGSARMQKISQKHLDLALFKPRLSLTQKLGMSATASFITGYPEETEEDQKATLDLMGSCFEYDRAPLNVQLHLLTPEPGTALLAKYQDKIAFDGHISDFNFPTLEPDDTAMMRQYAKVFINHHYFPSVLPRGRHIFITAAYPFLYSLGFPVLRHILHHFQRKLSCLLESMFNWAVKNNEPLECSQSALERFFLSHFGESSHVPGLVRYMLHAAELRRRAINEPDDRTPARPRTRRSMYRLSRRSILLRHVPDCPRILKVLVRKATGRIDQRTLQYRYDFLLHLPLRETELVSNFVMNKPGAALLEYFQNPNTWPDAGKFRVQTGYDPPPTLLVKQLIAQGVLETVNDVF